MEDMAHEFQEQEVNNTVQEFSINFVDLPPYLALVCVIGIVTNAALLYILTKIDMKNTQNGFILSLTLSNLLFVLIFMPFDIAAIGSKSYPFSETVCKGIETLCAICFFVWPFTLIALNVRCILEKPALSSGRMPKSTIIAIWILALALAVPSMVLSFSYYSDDDKVFHCPAFELSFLKLEIFVQFFTIVAVPAVAAGCFIYDAKKRDRLGNMRNREQKEVLRLILVLTAVYTLFLFPRSFLDVVSLHSSYNYNAFWHGVNVTGLLVYFGYPSASVVALFCASGSNRQLFKQHIMLFWCKSGNQEAVVGRETGMQSLVHPARDPVTFNAD